MVDSGASEPHYGDNAAYIFFARLFHHATKSTESWTHSSASPKPYEIEVLKPDTLRPLPAHPLQLVNAGVIENVFSLCFGTVEGEGAMLLGDAPLPSTLRLQYTPLVSSLAHPFYYNVKLEGLVVGGRQLPLQEVRLVATWISQSV